MAKYKSKKKVVEKPVIECGWVDLDKTVCSFNCKEELQLSHHIEDHFRQYKLEIEREEVSLDELPCVWSGCAFATKENVKELERHLYYHGYLAGLLALGKFEVDNNKGIPQCNKRVNKNEFLLPNLTNDFCCNWGDCERSFASIVEFHHHVVDHVNFEHEMQKTPENDRRRKWSCDWRYCKKQLDNKYRLLEHIPTHTTKKYVACFQCGELFRTRTTLFEHLRRQPENNTYDYQCAQCFKFFATEKLLRIHVVKHVNRVKCSLCDMTCSSLNTLALHVRYRHLKDKPYKCTECDLRWVRKNDLAKHIRFVHTNEIHRCDQPECNYAVRSYNMLRRHFLEVHRNSPFIYVCHCCEKPFKTGKSLSSHLIKKHDFQLPSGHKRFTYRVDENGFYRLETMRLESLEVTKQLKHSPNPFEPNQITEDSSCYEIVSMTNQNERIIVSNNPVEAHLVGEVIISVPEPSCKEN